MPQHVQYKSYVALFSQTGTDNPVVNIVENTIGNIVWTRMDVGVYDGVLVGAFPIAKTTTPPFGNQYSLIGIYNLLPFDYGYRIGRRTDDVVRVACSKANGDDADLSEALGGDLPILVEIRVYP